MTPEQLALVTNWHRAKQQLSAAEAYERELRQAVVASFFGDYGEGSRSRDIGNGYTLKNSNTVRYDVADNDGLRQLVRNFQQYAPTADVGKTLLKDKPRLSVRAYKALPEWGAKLMWPYVTIMPQLPQLSIVEPKDT